jgi:hypothetical protein
MLKHAILRGGLMLISGASVVAQQPRSTPEPTPEHKKLSAFVGTWKDEAEMKPGPLGPGGRMSLTETCEWFTGGFSIVCHTETFAGVGNLKTLTVLTYDPDEKVYRSYEFNSIGQCNSAKGTVDGDTWTFNSESKRGAKPIKNRFTIKLSSPDSATMKSEVSVDDGPWTLFMELKCSRAEQALNDYNPCAHASEGWMFECVQNYLDRIHVPPSSRPTSVQ